MTASPVAKQWTFLEATMKTPITLVNMPVVLMLCVCNFVIAADPDPLMLLKRAEKLEMTETYTAREYIGNKPDAQSACSIIKQRRNADGSVYRRVELINRARTRLIGLKIYNNDGIADMFLFKNGAIKGVRYDGGIPSYGFNRDRQYELKSITHDSRAAWEITGHDGGQSRKVYIIDKANGFIVAVSDYDREGKLLLTYRTKDIVRGASLPDSDFVVPKEAELAFAGNMDDAENIKADILYARGNEVARERKRLARQRRRQIRNSKILGVFSRITGSDDPLAWFLDNAPFLLMPVAVIAIGTACAIKRRRNKP